MPIVIRLALAALPLLPMAASAQDAFFNSINQGAIDYAGTVAVNSALEPGDEDAGAAKDPPAASRGARFRPSAAVSRQVRDIFVAAYGARHPERRARYARQIDSGQLAAPFEALLARHHLARDDFSDVAAGWFIALWSVIHDRPVTDAEARGAIAQIRRVTLASPGALPPTDTARQITAEAQALYAGVVLREHARRAGDPAAAARLRERVAARARARGLDLSVLELTADGFRPAAAPAHAAGSG